MDGFPEMFIRNQKDLKVSRSVSNVFSVGTVQPFSREFVFNFKKKRMTDCTSVQSVIYGPFHQLLFKNIKLIYSFLV